MKKRALSLILLSTLACSSNQDIGGKVDPKFQVSPGYVSLEDIELRQIEEDNNYIALYNKKTEELLPLVYIEGETHLGDYKHRFLGLKNETLLLAYNNGKPAGEIVYQLSNKWKELWFLLGGNLQ